MADRNQYESEKKRLIDALLAFVERAAKENATAEEVAVLPAVAGRVIDVMNCF